MFIPRCTALVWKCSSSLFKLTLNSLSSYLGFLMKPVIFCQQISPVFSVDTSDLPLSGCTGYVPSVLIINNQGRVVAYSDLSSTLSILGFAVNHVRSDSSRCSLTAPSRENEMQCVWPLACEMYGLGILLVTLILGDDFK